MPRRQCSGSHLRLGMIDSCAYGEHNIHDLEKKITLEVIIITLRDIINRDNTSMQKKNDS